MFLGLETRLNLLIDYYFLVGGGGGLRILGTWLPTFSPLVPAGMFLGTAFEVELVFLAMFVKFINVTICFYVCLIHKPDVFFYIQFTVKFFNFSQSVSLY